MVNSVAHQHAIQLATFARPTARREMYPREVGVMAGETCVQPQGVAQVMIERTIRDPIGENPNPPRFR